MILGVEQDKENSINDGRWREVKNEHSDLMKAIDIILFLHLLVTVDHVRLNIL